MTRDLPDTQLLRIFSELGFITSSSNVSSILQRARKAAQVSDVTVLIEGETGTGKQVLAHSIHRLDEKRKAFSFVTVHCGTINETLAESEFFGHQRGAFSGAVSERKGLFQTAHRGTLLLDDVNDLPLELQSKLLDVIQRGMVRSVGSDRETPVDVRILAACNQPLEPLVRQGRFRSDLYYRLNVVKLSLPPLRERKADLAELILSLARRHSSIYGPIETVEAHLVAVLETMPFWGNVRELENAVQRMLFLKTTGMSLGRADWMAQSTTDAISGPPDFLAEAASAMWNAISERGISYAQTLAEIEKRVLETAMTIQGLTRKEVAQRLRTSERNLYYKLRSFKLSPPAPRSGSL